MTPRTSYCTSPRLIVGRRDFMPPKRKAPSTSAPKRKAKKAPAPDWRTPLFYWRGKVDGSTWEGTWVASTEGLPSNEEFEASENTFKLKCSKTLGNVWQHDDDDEPVSFTGSYKLDNGEGPADFTDIKHEIWAHNGPPAHHPSTSSWAVVGACGDTEFGRFVSLGRLDQKADGCIPGGEQYTRLTLARRYIADDDPRKEMSAKDVALRVASCGNDEGVIDVPWLALPWKVPTNWPGGVHSTFTPELMSKLEEFCEAEGTDWSVGLAPAGPSWGRE